MNLSNRNRILEIENRFVVAKGVGPGRGMEWELLHKLSCVEWINNKVLPYSTGLPRGC